MALLGIDLGTSAVKVIVLDTEGRSLSVSKVGYEVMAPRPGWAEGDPNAWWRATVSAVQAAIAQAPHARITAIGLSGQMHGVVPTDKGGRHALHCCGPIPERRRNSNAIRCCLLLC